MDKVDVIVVGAGVVGLAIAAELSRTYSNTLIIDRHNSVGQETSSRNSEVIHAGIYYPTNSLKAELCVEGKHLIYQYCQQFNIPHKAIGKLLIAVNEQEQTKLQDLQNQAKLNGVEDLKPLSSKEIHDIEPELVATNGLLSPSTGIIDSHEFMASLLWQVEQRGGFFVGNSEFVSAIEHPNGFLVTIRNGDDSITELVTQYLINAAGLWSNQVANRIDPLPQQFVPDIYFARGHYFSYSGKHPFRHLIYPMPEKGGLGIHGTLDMGHQLRFGPDVEYIDQINYQIPQNLKPKFLSAIKRYWPTINSDHLQVGYSGIRPKLQGPEDAFRDFEIQGPNTHGVNGLINLYGIESPGLTSSLAIGGYIRKLLE